MLGLLAPEQRPQGEGLRSTGDDRLWCPPLPLPRRQVPGGVRRWHRAVKTRPHLGRQAVLVVDDSGGRYVWPGRVLLVGGGLGRPHRGRRGPGQRCSMSMHQKARQGRARTGIMFSCLARDSHSTLLLSRGARAASSSAASPAGCRDRVGSESSSSDSTGRTPHTSRSSVQPTIGNLRSLAHGAWTAAILSEMCGVLPVLLGTIAYMGTFTVRFQAPVPLRERLLGRATLDGRERRKLFVSATLSSSATSTELANASMIMIVASGAGL